MILENHKSTEKYSCYNINPELWDKEKLYNIIEAIQVILGLSPTVHEIGTDEIPINPRKNINGPIKLDSLCKLSISDNAGLYTIDEFNQYELLGRKYLDKKLCEFSNNCFSKHNNEENNNFNRPLASNVLVEMRKSERGLNRLYNLWISQGNTLSCSALRRFKWI